MEKKIKGTRALVVAAVLAALGVLCLALGSLLQVLDLSMAVIASLFVVFAVIELGDKYAVLVFVVTAILSVLLIPTKTAPLVYLCFAGYYPILKAKFEARMPRFLSLLVKILFFNAMLALMMFLLLKVLLITVPSPHYYWLLLLLTPVFVLYDVSLSRLVTIYLYKLRDRFRFLHK